MLLMPPLNEFFKMWPNKKVIARFTIIDMGSTSEALKGYYYNYVVPTFRQAIWDSGERKNEEKTELFLREISPIMHSQTVNEETGKYTTVIREINDLSNQELIDHIDHLKQIAAEEYAVFIDDPR